MQSLLSVVVASAANSKLTGRSGRPNCHFHVAHPFRAEATGIRTEYRDVCGGAVSFEIPTASAMTAAQGGSRASCRTWRPKTRSFDILPRLKAGDSYRAAHSGSPRRVPAADTLKI